MVAVGITLLFSVLPLFASAIHSPPHLRHRRLANSVRHVSEKGLDVHAANPVRSNDAHAEAHRVIKRQVVRRGASCQTRQGTNSTSAEPTTTSATWSATQSNNAVAAFATGGSTSWKGQKHSSTTTTSSLDWSQSATSSASSSSSSESGSGSGSSGQLQITDSCGWCGSSSTQPNGSEEWLNCGINSPSGWNPPMVTMNQLIASDLTASGVFAACADYIDRFNQYGGQYNIHPIMLASFAMQESSCGPGKTGGNGEAGLMQLASENCNGAPDGANGQPNCYDVNFNIQRGAELFASLVTGNGNNVVTAVGLYNGWTLGMTKNDATAAASQGDCWAQNNLDYIYQLFNGWMQDKDGSQIGQYFNLANC